MITLSSSMFLLFTFLSFWGFVSKIALGQHDISGGDPIMILFTKAQADASQMTREISDGNFSSGVDPAVSMWLNSPVGPTQQKRSVLIANDIARSVHEWKVDDRGFGRCAGTVLSDNMDNEGPRPTVYLFLNVCRETLNLATAPLREAAQTLIHEAVHHFGIGDSPTDEEFASKVAMAVVHTWITRRQMEKPFWYDLSVTNMPEPRSLQSAVWGVDQSQSDPREFVIIWGGCNGTTLPGQNICDKYLSSGSIVSIRASRTGSPIPTTIWQEMDVSTSPPGRAHHSAVFTGDSVFTPISNKMIIFGGCRSSTFACSETLGFYSCTDPDQSCNQPNFEHVMYDLKADKWSSLSATNAPTARLFHSAVWANDSMIVWGGLTGYQNDLPEEVLGDGGILQVDDENSDGKWTSILANLPNSPSARFGHSAVWTGEQMIIWGGCTLPGDLGCRTYTNTGAVFDPPTQTFSPMNTPEFLSGRTDHSTTLAGKFMVVYGGKNTLATGLSDGAIYDIEKKSWRALPQTTPSGVDMRRYGHRAVFDSLRGRVLFWGGQANSRFFHKEVLVLALSPDGSADEWSILPLATAPLGRVGHTGIMAKDAFLIWGGFGANGSFLNNGSVLTP